MTGKHLILIESAHIKYQFEIKRNLTIIRGDSATGKTTLIELLRDYARDPANGPIHVQSDVPCAVFSGAESDRKSYLQYTSGTIVFIDEGYSFIRTKEFADIIRQTDNYYVLITRESLPCLPISIHEIYGIRTSGRYHYPEQIFHEFYPLYEEQSGHIKSIPEPAVLISEDSQSGYLFLKECCKTAACISAEGNSNILKLMQTFPRDKRLVILADGAAFGAFIGQVLSVASFYQNILLYFPESFEWMILKSGILSVPDLNAILKNPEEYIESSKYFSWEQFFTDFLIKETRGDPVRQYRKNQLSAFYLEGKNKEQILCVFPKQIQNSL